MFWLKGGIKDKLDAVRVNFLGVVCDFPFIFKTNLLIYARISTEHRLRNNANM